MWRRGCCNLLHLKISIVLLAFQCTDCGNRAGEFSTVSMGNAKRMWRSGCCHLLHLKISIVLLAFQCTDCGNRAGEFSAVSMGNGKSMWRRGCCHLLHLKICIVFAFFPVHRLRQPCRGILNSLHGQQEENVEARLLPSVALEDIHRFACFPVHRLREPCRGILNSLHGQREENVEARLLPSVALEDMRSFCFLSSAQIAATVQGNSQQSPWAMGRECEGAVAAICCTSRYP